MRITEQLCRRDVLKLGAAACIGRASAHAVAAGQQRESQAATESGDRWKGAPDLLPRCFRAIIAAPGPGDWYDWLDADTPLLLLSLHRRTRVYRASVVDARTGRAAPLAAFNKRNTTRLTRLDVGTLDPWEHAYPRLSPDRSRLHWLTGQMSNRARWVASTMDGDSEEWLPVCDDDGRNLSSSAYAARRPDGQRWTECIWRGTGDSKLSLQVITHMLGMREPVSCARAERMPWGYVVGAVQDGIVIAVPIDQTVAISYPSPPLWMLAHRNGSIAARPLVLPSPAAPMFQDLALSPRGDRLAWSAVKISPGGRKARIRVDAALCVAELGGAHSRVVVTTVAYGGPRSGNTAGNVRWLPDGKRLSFAFNGALFTVPV